MKVAHLDLTPYLNNIGTCLPGDSERGGFTLGGAFLPAEHLPAYGSELTWGEHSFVFPLKRDDGHDNVALEGQEIAVSGGPHRYMDILGASSNGNFYDQVELLRDGEVVCAFTLKLSEAIGDKSWFDEPVVLECPLLRNKRRELPNFRPKLYLHREQLPDGLMFDTIRMCDNEFMHVFAITLRGNAE